MEDMEQRTLSDIICDNTIIEKVQERALEIPNPVTNPIRVCQRAAGAEGGLVSEVVTTASVTAAPETTQPPTLPPAPVSLQQRVPKSLAVGLGAGGQKFLGPFDPNFNFETLRPRHSSGFPGRHPHQSIFDAFRRLQTREFHRIAANSSALKPVKFLERFDHSDAIILNP